MAEKHRLTKQVMKQISQMAKKLPQCDYTYNQKYTGNQLLQREVLTDQNKQPIQTNKLYDIEHHRTANHKRRMRRIFEREGMAGVLKYREEVILMADEALDEARWAMLPWYKKTWFTITGFIFTYITQPIKTFFHHVKNYRSQSRQSTNG